MAPRDWCEMCVKLFEADSDNNFPVVLEHVLKSHSVSRRIEATTNPGFYRGRVLHKIQDLEKSASCRFCKLLLRITHAVHGHLQSKGCDWAPFTVELLWVLVTNGQVMLGLKPIGDGWVVDGGIHTIYTMYCSPALPCPFGLFPVLDFAPGAASPAALRRMLAWIRQCTTQHSTCGTVGLSSPLPTRVLDVSDPNNIKLVESSGMTGRYLCLSHCWGAHQPLRTLESNYTDHLTDIPWSAIPETFQDAITLTRKLGFSYLWIDSLCITQDSAADWEAESQRMMEIYHNCFLTIAATSSPSSNTGLFLETTVPTEVSGIMPTTTEQGPPDVYAYNLRPSVQHFSRVLLSSDFDRRWPLLTRAWVLQERLLSPRVLHIARPELFWECRACTECECTAQPGNHTPPMDIGPLTTLKPDYWSTATNQETKPFTSQYWWALVELYTSLKLTVRSDIFPALSGLVKHIVSASSPGFTAENYLAGLWRPTLLLDLVWKNNREYIRHEAVLGPREYLAPSWSWASGHRRTDTGVVYPGGGFRRAPRRPGEEWEGFSVVREYVDVVEANTNTGSGLMGVGRGEDGNYIKLSGYLFRGRLRCRVGMKGKEWKVGERLRVRCDAEIYVPRMEAEDDDEEGEGKGNDEGDEVEIGADAEVGGGAAITEPADRDANDDDEDGSESGASSSTKLVPHPGVVDEGGEFNIYAPSFLRASVELDTHPAEALAVREIVGVCNCEPAPDNDTDCKYCGDGAPAELREKEVAFVPIVVVDHVLEKDEDHSPGPLDKERLTLVLEQVESGEPGLPKFRRIGMLGEQLGLEDGMFIWENLGRRRDAEALSTGSESDGGDAEGEEGGWMGSVYGGTFVIV